MRNGDKPIIHAFAVTWAGMVGGAYHWHGELKNTETGAVEYVPESPDKEDALRGAINKYFELYDYNETVLLVTSSQVDLFRGFDA